MQQLAGLDAAFLSLETAQMPMHVGALHLLELPADYGGDYVEALRAHIAARLPMAPVLRRRLAAMPLNLANPAWVDAEPDLSQHIVGITLPAGSGLAELEAAVGRLHAHLLDRELPLWKFYVFEGLAPGPEGQQHLALYTQLHHAAVDGQAAVALAAVILDPSAQPRAPRQVARAVAGADPAHGELGSAGMLRGALAQQWQQSLKLARAMPGAAGTLGSMAWQTVSEAAGARVRGWLARLAGQAVAGERVSNLGLAPRTRLNASVSAERRFATARLPLATLHEVRRRHGASLNDALLFVIGGALRRLFQRHGPLPRKSLVAAVPVSMRAAGDATANTQATMSLVSLGTHLADPARRLAHLLEASGAMKSQLGSVKALMPTDYPSLGMPWLMQAGAQLYGRAQLAERLPVVANLVVSNVPGPALPLYLAGARMLSNYPASIVVHGLALNITAQSYDEHLDLGLMACAQALPEVAELAAYMEAAWLEFQVLPAGKSAKTATRTPSKTSPKAAPKTAPKRPSKPRSAVTPATGRPRASSRKRAAPSR